MIICFSATGNSRLIAETLARELSDSLISLNDIMKNGSNLRAKSDSPFVFVFPIHAWNIPFEVSRLISEGDFDGSKEAYFVYTMGGSAGHTPKYCAKLAKDKGLIYKGSVGVLMPDNYIPYEKAIDETANKKIVEEAIRTTKAVADKIRSRGPIAYSDPSRLGGILSGYVHRMFTKYLSDAKYYVKDGCIGCGACVKLCPKNNIRLENGKPVFLGHCMGCLSCFNLCPKNAIENKGKTEGRPRYKGPQS